MREREKEWDENEMCQNCGGFLRSLCAVISLDEETTGAAAGCWLVRMREINAICLSARPRHHHHHHHLLTIHEFFSLFGALNFFHLAPALFLRRASNVPN
jgi:hypothetical protein